GTSGVRGEIHNTLTPELAIKLSLAFAKFLGGSGFIAIGRDVRFQSSILAKACVAGATSGGLNVVDCGVLPTPALLHVVKELKLNGAIMVTASHTPPHFAGLLFFNGDTAELSPKEHEKIEKLVFSGSLSGVSWNEVGRVENFTGCLDIYLKSILRQVNVKAARSLGAKIVVDPSNSAQCMFLPLIARELGCEVFLINDFPDGAFPGRGPDLHPRFLTVTANYTKQLSADFAIATDGDGDRCLFVNEHGEVLWGDVVGCLFAREELMLKGGGVIVCPINTSNLIEYVCEIAGGEVRYSKVGPPAIIDVMKRFSNVIFAFEESGKYIWPKNVYYGDPGLALGKILEILCKYGGLSSATSNFPRFHRVKIAVPCPEELKVKVLNWLKNKVSELNPSYIVDLDGLKVIFDDGSWLLLRPSGTEPVFRVFSESLDSCRADELAELGSSLVREALSEFT
ncbi:MAG: hypothetical protein DRJ26_00980, partial [Candidatus Methanomethylicota archaeon]